jgi:hypothetical protein
MTEYHQGYPAVVMSFKNSPNTILGQQTESFYEVTANLTYVGEDRAEHIDYGNWLNEYTRYIDFRPGETRDLVIARKKREKGLVLGLYTQGTESNEGKNPLRNDNHS